MTYQQLEFKIYTDGGYRARVVKWSSNVVVLYFPQYPNEFWIHSKGVYDGTEHGVSARLKGVTQLMNYLNSGEN